MKRNQHDRAFRNVLQIAVLLLVGLASGVRAADLSIVGTVSKPQSLSVDEFKQACASSIQSVDFSNRSGKHKAKAVPLTAALELAGVDLSVKPSPEVSPAKKHPSLRMAVMVRGGDGYAVLFSLAELATAVGHRSVWIAVDQDDQPLPAAEGPLKLLVPDDAGPARSVRNIQQLQIIDLAVATTQPTIK